MKVYLIIFSLFLSFPLFSSAQHSLVESEMYSVEAERISFSLRNNSLKSIPLLIPGVMNPNLSPMSNSGVTLRIGQKILFKYKGKKRVLLLVSEELEGKVLNVSKLLKERKNEIDEARK